MVLRHLYIQHENKKRQREAEDRELAPYQNYLDETIERVSAQERAILAPRREVDRRPQISLAEAFVKLPIKSIQELDNRLWLARREKRLTYQVRRDFLEWIRSTKPHLEPHGPQEHVQRFAESYKTPFLKAYEEGYQEGFELGRQLEREEQAERRNGNNRNCKNEN